MPHHKYSAEVRRYVFTNRTKGKPSYEIAEYIRSKYPEHADITPSAVDGLYYRQKNTPVKGGKTDRKPPAIKLPGPSWAIPNINNVKEA